MLHVLPSVKGCHSNQKFVIVQGRQSQEELANLGCFGADHKNTQRRELAQKGLSGTLQIYEPGDQIATILSLHEAFFLSHAFGILTITNKQGDSMTLSNCWESFKEYNPSFPIEYAVYFHYRTRGWIVKDGNIYGVSFLLYKNDPSRVHSKYGVIICDKKKSFQSLFTSNRVLQSVKKELIIVFLSSRNPNLHPEVNELSNLTPSNMKDFVITTRKFKSFPNFIPKTKRDDPIL